MSSIDISIVVYNTSDAKNFYLRETDNSGDFVQLGDPTIETKEGALIPVYHPPAALDRDLGIATNLAAAIEILVNYLAQLDNRIRPQGRPLPGEAYNDFEWDPGQRLFLPTQTWLANYLTNPAYYWERWKNPAQPPVPFVLFDVYAVELNSPLEIKLIVKKVRATVDLGLLAILFSTPMTVTIGKSLVEVKPCPPITATPEPIPKQAVDILAKQRLLAYGKGDTDAAKRAIQRDLRIVGHYIGEIDGDVRGQSLQAFVTFGLKHGIVNAPWADENVLLYLANDVAVILVRAGQGG